MPEVEPVTTAVLAASDMIISCADVLSKLWRDYKAQIKICSPEFGANSADDGDLNRCNARHTVLAPKFASARLSVIESRFRGNIGCA
jgi:hypothetical protein